MEVRCVAQVSDRLGEGPFWSPLDGRLWWFDIKGKRLNWLDPDRPETGRYLLPVRASAAAPRADGGLIVATEAGLAAFDPASGELEIVQPMAFEPGFRTNDGKLDPFGNFWWSTMDDAGGARPGAVFRTTPDWKTERVLDGIHIANAIAWSPDGGRFYLADSKKDVIWAYETADLSRREVFASTGGRGASPDGAATDAHGFLWNAEWGGARLVRYAPDGSEAASVPMPVSQPTSCAFGGRDLQTLYVTSAWDELSDDRRAGEPLAGGLFALEPGVAGAPSPLFEG